MYQLSHHHHLWLTHSCWSLSDPMPDLLLYSEETCSWKTVWMRSTKLADVEVFWDMLELLCSGRWWCYNDIENENSLLRVRRSKRCRRRPQDAPFSRFCSSRWRFSLDWSLVFGLCLSKLQVGFWTLVALHQHTIDHLIHAPDHLLLTWSYVMIALVSIPWIWCLQWTVSSVSYQPWFPGIEATCVRSSI